MNAKPALFALVSLALIFHLSVQGATKAEKEPGKAELEFFERRIRPILTEHCFSCHSRAADKVKGGLYLDSREGLLNGGENGVVVIPGNLDSSRLIIAVRHTDSDIKMPPKKSLSTGEINDLEAWVQAGAAYPKSRSGNTVTTILSLDETRNKWPFLPIKAIQPPKVRMKEWPLSTIDSLVLARLEANGVAPAVQAPTRDLVRRIAFDLTGLPPDTKTIDRFAAGITREQLGAYVNELMNSPQFGEKWGRHWLDVARYADSNGLESNLPYPEAWRYRDYVIRSFNSDKPYDQFIREQICGDLLTHSNREQEIDNLVATGFLAIGPKSTPMDQSKFLMDVADEQMDVITRGLQGVTVSCARCHDHKFDPIPTREYYSLAGILRSTRSVRDPSSPSQPPIAGPWLEIPMGSREEILRVEAFDKKLAELSEQIREARRQRQILPGGVASSQLEGIILDNDKAVLTGSWKSSTYSTNRFVDKDYLQDGDSSKGRKSARFIPTLPTAGRYEVRIAYPAAQNRAKTVPVYVVHKGGTQKIVVDQQQPPEDENLWHSLGTFEFEAGTNSAVTISNEGTKGFVVADAIQFLMQDNTMMMAAKERKAARDSSGRPPAMQPSRDPDALEAERDELNEKAPPRPPMAMAVQEGSALNLKINLRGDPAKLGDEAPRGIPSILYPKGVPPVSIPANESGRRQLADWLSSTNNPLTARVEVNRIWLHLFGRPLAGTPDNFGALGEKPSSVELLDHLALRFMQLGWSHKKLIQEIMLSRTYQMSCEASPSARAKDADNQLMSRMPRRRLEAEAIRDAILKASGKLDPTAGGPAVATDRAGGNDSNPQAAMGVAGAELRRSVYLPILRNNVPDFLQAFDFADPHVLSAKRNNTSAPAQALFMLNSDFLYEQSLAMSEHLLKLPSDSERLRELFRRVLSRDPDSDETDRSLKFVDRFSSMQPANTSDVPARTEAWRALAHSLFAGTEFRFLN